MVAAAIVGGAVVAGVGSAVAGSEAAGATRDATNANIAQQQAALQQQATLSQPYRDLGTSAIDKYKDLLGIGPGGATDIKTALESMPGYQFALDQGKKGIDATASLSGGVSGNTLADLTKFNQGLADTTYQQEVDNLARTVGTGQAAAAGQAQNVGAASANIGNALTAQGNNIANIDASTIAGITKAGSNASNNYLTLQALNNQGGGDAGASVSGGQLWS